MKRIIVSSNTRLVRFGATRYPFESLGPGEPVGALPLYWLELRVSPERERARAGLFPRKRK